MLFGGGFGNKGFGGGSLVVMRAVAIDGQTCRVVFNQKPVARSPIGSSDALNVANYRFAVVAPGMGAAPTAVGVEAAIVEGPAYGPVMAGQWGVDVHVDRPLVVGLTYLVTVANIAAASGDALGFPVSGTFPGIVLLHQAVPPTRDLSNIDLATDPFGGGFVWTAGGDIAQDGGLVTLKKRLLRRETTPQGAFRFLTDYGVGARLKAPASPRNIGPLKTDTARQLRREPEVARASVSVTIQGPVTTVRSDVETKTGLTLDLTVSKQANGRIVVGP